MTPNLAVFWDDQTKTRKNMENVQKMRFDRCAMRNWYRVDWNDVWPFHIFQISGDSDSGYVLDYPIYFHNFHNDFPSIVQRCAPNVSNKTNHLIRDVNSHHKVLHFKQSQRLLNKWCKEPIRKRYVQILGQLDKTMENVTLNQSVRNDAEKMANKDSEKKDRHKKHIDLFVNLRKRGNVP